MIKRGTFTWLLVAVQTILLCAALPAQDPSVFADQSTEIQQAIKKAEKLRNDARYDEALAIGEAALQEAESIGNDSLITESLYQISLVYYFLEAYEEASAYMEIGLTHARLHHLEGLEADLLNAQGVMQWKQGNLFEATAKLKAALEIQKSRGQMVSMASISNNLGIIAYSLKRYAEAVNHYRQGIDWLGDHDNPRMRSSLFSNIGESLIPLGMYDAAESYLMKSLALEKQFKDPHSLAYTYFNLGELRSSQDQSDEAIDLYEKALDIQNRIESQWSASLTRLRLSEEHLTHGHHDKAIEVILPGYEAVKRLNALTLLRDYANQLSQIYKAKGEEGLSEYYADLKGWFAERAEEKNQTDFVATTSAKISQKSTVIPSPPPQPDLSFVRIATVCLLAILVLILVIENVRLRIEMKEEKR